MTKPTGFILSGIAGCINVETQGSNDWAVVTDHNILDEVCKNAHVSGSYEFAECTSHYGTIYGGEMSFEFKNNQVWVNIQYEFNESVEVNEVDDIIVIDGNEQSFQDFIDEISEDASGQCSDGIGEGFEQYPCYEPGDLSYFISPGYPNFEYTLTYK